MSLTRTLILMRVTKLFGAERTHGLCLQLE